MEHEENQEYLLREVNVLRTRIRQEVLPVHFTNRKNNEAIKEINKCLLESYNDVHDISYVSQIQLEHILRWIDKAHKVCNMLTPKSLH